MCTIRQHSITPSLFCLSKSCFRVARADLRPLRNAHPTQALGLRWPRVLKKRLRAVRQSRTENSRNWSSLIKQFYHVSYSLQDRSEFIWAYLSMPYSSFRVVQFLLQTSSNTTETIAASAAGCCCYLSIVEILLFGNWMYICLESKWPRCCHTRLKLKKCRNRWWLSTDFSYCLTCSFYL